MLNFYSTIRRKKRTDLMINRNALFSDETARFKYPYEPETGERVTLRIRTLANDVLRVYAVIKGLQETFFKVSE